MIQQVLYCDLEETVFNKSLFKNQKSKTHHLKCHASKKKKKKKAELLKV